MYSTILAELILQSMFHLILLFLQLYIFDKRFCIFFLTKYDTRKVFKINTVWKEDKHQKKRKQFTTHFYEHLILNSPIKCLINRRPLNCWYLIFYQGSWLFLLSPKRMMRIMKVRTMTSRKVTITATMLELASSTWKIFCPIFFLLIWFFSHLVLLLQSESDLIQWNSIWLSIYRN